MTERAESRDNVGRVSSVLASFTNLLRRCMMDGFTKKVLFCICLLFLAAMVALYTVTQRTLIFMEEFRQQTPDLLKVRKTPAVTEKEFFDNSGAKPYLAQYSQLFHTSKTGMSVLPDPNKPETVTTWWQAAAMIDWYFTSPNQYKCHQILAVGNWHICQDEPYTIKPPCLVYSFGIGFDFTFDDAMASLGCEVHSFDPSMKMHDHKRGPNSTFHNMGLGIVNTNAFIPKLDMYVKELQMWKMRTVKGVMKELGHEKRVIDVFKMDVEGHEWDVLDNMMETGVFSGIRQFMLEYHLFPDYPLKADYVLTYKKYTQFREMGLHKYAAYLHTKTLKADRFNNQADIEYVNTLFDRRPT